jgi:glutamate formiminotransferase
MRLLTVPNWSFGRNRDLTQKFEEALSASDITVHYFEGDLDHNRTVTAFSGEADQVLAVMRHLAMAAFATIDLSRHVGVHPRIGALDVCPFVALPEWNVPFEKLDAQVQQFGEALALEHDLPVFLYERSEKGRHEADLPSLRKGGFGGLIGKELRPDFGPNLAHPRLGITVLGVRDFLIAMNVNLRTDEVLVAKEIARQIRTLRLEGDERFLGVRALGFPLVSRGLCQVSLNLTLPDITPPDPIIEWIVRKASEAQVAVDGTELIGVIRQKDLPWASRLPVRPEQVVDQIAHEV